MLTLSLFGREEAGEVWLVRERRGEEELLQQSEGQVGLVRLSTCPRVGLITVKICTQEAVLAA